jgi:hypothetical protein
MSIPVSVHQPSPDSTAGYRLDLTPDLSSANSTQPHCLDAEHQPTDLAIGGSNPSRRAPDQQIYRSGLLIPVAPEVALALKLLEGYPEQAGRRPNAVAVCALRLDARWSSGETRARDSGRGDDLSPSSALERQ